MRFASGRWWRTLSATRPRGGPAVPRPLPGRAGRRPTNAAPPIGAKTTVGDLADAEPLLAPAVAARSRPPSPSTRPVDDNATVAFRGNRYSVPPGLPGSPSTLRHRLATVDLEIHRRARAPCSSPTAWRPPGAGDLVRTPEHRAALGAGGARQLHHGPTL